MINILDELNTVLTRAGKNSDDIKWGKLEYKPGNIVLDATNENVLEKIEQLFKNIEYDDRYGGQELYGLVVFKDKTWLERGECDGLEWWEYKEAPKFGDYT